MYQTASLSTKEEPGPQGLLLAPVPVQLSRFPKYRGVFLLFVRNFKPMLLPLKQHSFKKLSIGNVNYTKTFDFCLKNFPSPRTFSQLQGFLITGDLCLKSNNSMKNFKKSKRPRDIYNRTIRS